MTRLRHWIGAAALAAAVALPTTASARFAGMGHWGGHMAAFHGSPGIRSFSAAGPHVGAFSAPHMHGPFVHRHAFPFHARGPFVGVYPSYYYSDYYADDAYVDQGYYGDYGDDVVVVPAILPSVLHALRAHSCGLVSVKHYSHHHAVWTKVRRC